MALGTRLGFPLGFPRDRHLVFFRALYSMLVFSRLMLSVCNASSSDFSDLLCSKVITFGVIGQFINFDHFPYLHCIDSLKNLITQHNIT